jgi:hypothetical protein
MLDEATALPVTMVFFSPPLILLNPLLATANDTLVGAQESLQEVLPMTVISDPANAPPVLIKAFSVFLPVMVLNPEFAPAIDRFNDPLAKAGITANNIAPAITAEDKYFIYLFKN